MNFEKIISANEIGKNWTNAEIARFHYFNENGLINEKRKINSQIDALVNAGICMSGAYIAHGSMNRIYCDMLIKLAQKKRVRSDELHSVLKCMRFTIENAKKFIAEQDAKNNLY